MELRFHLRPRVGLAGPDGAQGELLVFDPPPQRVDIRRRAAEDGCDVSAVELIELLLRVGAGLPVGLDLGQPGPALLVDLRAEAVELRCLRGAVLLLRSQALLQLQCCPFRGFALLALQRRGPFTGCLGQARALQPDVGKVVARGTEAGVVVSAAGHHLRGEGEMVGDVVVYGAVARDLLRALDVLLRRFQLAGGLRHRAGLPGLIERGLGRGDAALRRRTAVKVDGRSFFRQAQVARAAETADVRLQRPDRRVGRQPTRLRLRGACLERRLARSHPRLLVETRVGGQPVVLREADAVRRVVVKRRGQCVRAGLASLLEDLPGLIELIRRGRLCGER